MESNNELAIAPDYDPTEFAPLQLLEKGDVDVWVRRRGAILIEKSKEVAKECEAGKLASAITVGASVIMSANPLAWLPMSIGALGYIYTVFQEFQDTGSIRLIPMYRGKLGDILKVMEGGQAEQRHPLQDQIEYLSEAEKDEVLLINYRFSEIAGVLNTAPPKVRFDLYRHICGQFHARRDLLTGDEVQNYVNTAVSQERRTMPPQAEATSFLLPRPEYSAPPQLEKSPEPLSVPANFVTSPQPSTQRQSQRPAIRSAFTVALDNPYISRAVFGAQRTGKSYFCAVYSQERHRRGDKIYHINLASVMILDKAGNEYSEDDQYWSHAVRSVRGDISSMRPYEANQLIEEAIAVVEEFYSQHNAFLFIDEWAYLGNKDNAHAEALEALTKIVADKVGLLTSTGIKRDKAIWTIAPEFVAGTLTQSARSIKKSALLYITIAPNKFVDWNGNKIGFNAELFSQIKLNYPIDKAEGRFNQDRICYLNKEWIEMGDLPPLDPTLRPAIAQAISIPIADTHQSLATPEYSDTDKDEAVEVMVLSLTNSRATTLWGFVRDELGISESAEIREVALKIAQMLVDDELTALKEKFRIQSVWDVRYSYPDYAKKVAQMHRYTGGKCCCCLQGESKEAHHTKYLGFDDEPGKNMLPVCLNCHKTLCHGHENWIQGSPWEAHNIPEWEAKLQAGFEMLTQQRK